MGTQANRNDTLNVGSNDPIKEQSLCPAELKQGPKDGATLAQLFDTLLAHCLNQNDMMWSRTQLLIAVQGGVIVAAYYLSTFPSGLSLACYVLVGGAILTALMTLLAIEDQQDRDANREVMDKIYLELMKTLGWKDMQAIKFEKDDFFKFRLTKRPLWLVWADGDYILVFVFLGFIALDLVLCFRGF
jgi:hypothetical protein